MIYSLNMHTTVYQFWRFVYKFEQSVIDHYARISLYTLSLCTKIRLHVYHLSWPLNMHSSLFWQKKIGSIQLSFKRVQTWIYQRTEQTFARSCLLCYYWSDQLIPLNSLILRIFKNSYFSEANKERLELLEHILEYSCWISSPHLNRLSIHQSRYTNDIIFNNF